MCGHGYKACWRGWGGKYIVEDRMLELEHLLLMGGIIMLACYGIALFNESWLRRNKDDENE